MTAAEHEQPLLLERGVTITATVEPEQVIEPPKPFRRPRDPFTEAAMQTITDAIDQANLQE